MTEEQQREATAEMVKLVLEQVDGPLFSVNCAGCGQEVLEVNQEPKPAGTVSYTRPHAIVEQGGMQGIVCAAGPAYGEPDPVCLQLSTLATSEAHA